MKKTQYFRQLFLAAALVTGLGLGVVGIGTAMASQATMDDNMNSLVEAIAEKFDLEVSEVQAVFDEHHDQMREAFEAQQAERLAQEVTDGKITQEQADLITAKREEIKEFAESLIDSDDATRREEMKSFMDEVKQWAEENEIPLFFFQLGGPQNGPQRNMPGRGYGQQPNGFQPMPTNPSETN